MYRYTFQLTENDRPPLVIKAPSLRAAVANYQIPYPLAALLVGIEKE